ncbi:MAG: hypothetical protein IPK50_23100 [Fibrobacterota bacterium]|nr:MAG: hypothetical protein IPK50_23100 [Fibrobacterota bacterium]
MTPWALLATLCGILPDSTTGESRLRAVRWTRNADTLRMEFEFAGGRPRRFRIAALQEPVGKPALRIDFEGVVGRKLSKNLPGWIHGTPSADSAGLAVRVDLRKPLPWRATWRGDVLGVELAGRARDGSIWTDPRFLGVAGVGLAAGATALWMSRQEAATPAPAPAPSPSTNPDDGIIPPPGFGFPK